MVRNINLCLSFIGLNHYQEDDDGTEHNDQVFNVIKIPGQIEYTLWFGFFCCLDSILFMLTYLPIRIFYSVSSYVVGYEKLTKYLYYDLLRGIIILVSVLFLTKLPISQLYHFVRAQSFIKLYVMFNMLDIFERLFCTVGQDINDSLIFISKPKYIHNSKNFVGLFFRILLAVVYNITHSFMYFTRMVVLSAAINSDSKSLLSLLLSNNFVEIKSSVFKRFAEANLFQITCADIVERFEIILFLFLTTLNLESSSLEYFKATLFNSIIYIIGCEIIVDWIKHMFILRFNKLQYNVYVYYREILARDLLLYFQQDKMKQSVDINLAVARRIGLATSPLTCVILRFVYYILQENNVLTMRIVTLLFLNLLVLKFFISLSLRSFACYYVVKRETSLLNSLEELNSEQTIEKHQKRVELLSKVKRYMLFSSRVPH